MFLSPRHEFPFAATSPYASSDYEERRSCLSVGKGEERPPKEMMMETEETERPHDLIGMSSSDRDERQTFFGET